MKRAAIIVAVVIVTVAAAVAASVVLSDENAYPKGGIVGPASRYPVDGHMHGEHGV